MAITQALCNSFKKELLEEIESYEKMIRNDSLMKTFKKHMRGAFVVRLGRLNAELKRRK